MKPLVSGYAASSRVAIELGHDDQVSMEALGVFMNKMGMLVKSLSVKGATGSRWLPANYNLPASVTDIEWHSNEIPVAEALHLGLQPWTKVPLLDDISGTR